MKRYFLFTLALVICLHTYSQGVFDDTHISNEDGIGGLSNAIGQYTESEVNAMQKERELQGKINGHIGEGLDHLNTFFGIYQNANEMYDALQALNPDECIPDLSVSGANMMPSSCEEGSECYTCYKSAVDELNFIRRQLARMSCICNNTKNFAEKAMAFGDNVSGIHGALGLSWQYYRAGIEESVTHMKGTYKQKYTEFMATLQHALMGISECEAKYGQRDWYKRYGFIYFEFMQDKYLVN